MDLKTFNPSKIKLAGILALLVIDWIGGFLSRLAFQPTQRIYNANFSNFTRFGGSGLPIQQNYSYQLYPTVLNYVILAVLFYVVVSIIVESSAEKK